MLVVAEETTEPQSDAQIKVGYTTTAPHLCRPTQLCQQLAFSENPSTTGRAELGSCHPVPAACQLQGATDVSVSYFLCGLCTF